MRCVLSTVLLLVSLIAVLNSSCWRSPTGVETGEQECFVYIPHDTPPSVKDRVVPFYPEEARMERIEGTVVLHLFVDIRGYVEDVCIAVSVHPLLDREAVAAARATTFYPARRDGMRIGVWVVYPVRFEIAP